LIESFFSTLVRRLEQQEDLVLTPFEKNLEVWRQLWRVVERSNVIVQVMLALPSYSPLSGESVPPSKALTARCTPFGFLDRGRA
jgi:hypothetical protein